MENCKTCEFWREFSEKQQPKGMTDSLGMCYLKPPVLLLMPVAPSVTVPNGGMALQGYRPQTLAGDGCADHRRNAVLKH